VMMMQILMMRMSFDLIIKITVIIDIVTI